MSQEKQTLAERLVQRAIDERQAYWTQIMAEQGYTGQILFIKATCARINESNLHDAQRALVHPTPTHSKAILHARCEQLKADMAAQIVRGELMAQLKATGLQGRELLLACEEKMKELNKQESKER